MYPKLIEKPMDTKKEFERAFGYKFPISWDKFVSQNYRKRSVIKK